MLPHKSTNTLKYKKEEKDRAFSGSFLRIIMIKSGRWNESLSERWTSHSETGRVASTPVPHKCYPMPDGLLSLWYGKKATGLTTEYEHSVTRQQEVITTSMTTTVSLHAQIQDFQGNLGQLVQQVSSLPHSAPSESSLCHRLSVWPSASRCF